MSSDLSFSGSCEHDLILSKFWLAKNLPNRPYNKIYVLGSWYGNMGLILKFLNFDFKLLVNIDTNKKYCQDNQKIYKIADFDQPYKILNRNCNKVDYSDADLIINCSVNDIKKDVWFDQIPHNCLVAIQCRNNQPFAFEKDRPNSFNEFQNLFEFKKILYKGKLNLKNFEEKYQRYMIIGHK